MTRSVEIPDAAVEAGGWIIAEHRSRSWLVYSDEVRASLAKSWEPTARAVLVAARPYLMPTQEALAAAIHRPRCQADSFPCSGPGDVDFESADAVLALINGISE